MHFTDGDDLVNCCSEITFPEDGVGLDGNGNITLTFDMAVLIDFPPRNEPEIDDLHFGGAVPAPAGFLPLLAFALTTGRRRRR